MSIDRPFLAAWAVGLLIHGAIVFAGYRAIPASGEILYEDLVPIEIVEVEPVSDPEPALVPETEAQEPRPVPVPEPEPEPAGKTMDPPPPTPTGQAGTPDPEADPQFGLGEESVVDPPEEGAHPVLEAPVGNTVGMAPEGSVRQDSVSALAPVPYHQLTVPPELIRGAEPGYPAQLRREGIEGRVVVELVLDTDGMIREAKVIKSPHDDFSAAALEAIRSFRFKPGFQGQRPVPVRILVPFDFEIR